MLPKMLLKIYSPGNGMHLLPNIHNVVFLGQLADGKIVAWQQLLSVLHAHKPDDMISYMEISNRKFHVNHSDPNMTTHLHDPNIHDLFMRTKEIIYPNKSLYIFKI